MLRRTVIGSLLVVLLTFSSSADEGKKAKSLRIQTCYKALAAVESQLQKRVQDKTLNEKQIDEANLLLDEADWYCSKSILTKGEEKIISARELIAESIKEKVD